MLGFKKNQEILRGNGSENWLTIVFAFSNVTQLWIYCFKQLVVGKL